MELNDKQKWAAEQAAKMDGFSKYATPGNTPQSTKIRSYCRSQETSYWASSNKKALYIDNPGCVDIHLSRDGTKLWITIDGQYALVINGMLPESTNLCGIDKWERSNGNNEA